MSKGIAQYYNEGDKVRIIRIGKGDSRYVCRDEYIGIEGTLITDWAMDNEIVKDVGGGFLSCRLAGVEGMPKGEMSCFSVQLKKLED